MPPALDVNDAAAPWPDLESPRVPATPKAPRRRFRQRIKSLPYSLSLLAAVGLVFFVYKHIAGGAWDTEASAQEAAARRLNGMDERINAGDYPNEIFSAEDLKSGAIVLHFLGMIYMFIAVISEFFKISDDVAGATFMAAGGSAPELFTSFIGVFVAKSQVGFGTIVGSAVFNVLFVIGMCGMFAREVLKLTWWPLFRDSCYYVVSLTTLVVFFLDDVIELYESLILFALYFGYVTVCFYNVKLYACWMRVCGRRKVLPESSSTDDLARKPKTVASGADLLSAQRRPDGSGFLHHRITFQAGVLRTMFRHVDPKGVGPAPHVSRRFHRASHIVFDAIRRKKMISALEKSGRSIRGSVTDRDLKNALARINAEQGKPPGVAIASASTLGPTSPAPGSTSRGGPFTEPRVTSNSQEKYEVHPESQPATSDVKVPAQGENNKEGSAKQKEEKAAPGGNDEALVTSAVTPTPINDKSSSDESVERVNEKDLKPNGEEEEEEEEGPVVCGMSWPSSCLGRAWFILIFPIGAVLKLTVPDVKEKKWRKFTPLAFVMSIVWIGFFSYMMVWWANTAGIVLDIPPVVMGLTILAAGTSVPDLLTSVIVARQGLGDMAVSSSIGSNIFDVLVGLPLPWILHNIILGDIIVTSTGLRFSIVMLLGMLVAVIVSIAVTGWRLGKLLATIMFILYAVLLTVNLLVEYSIIPSF
ncbi:SLC24A2 [Symbiodinium sp. KB8]|nr:SLC24A2 [Symbiodinium sp. KB8]